jgi:hypothetical protein
LRNLPQRRALVALVSGPIVRALSKWDSLTEPDGVH